MTTTADHSLGWEKLLLALAPDRERAGAAYEELRRRLVQRFAWRGAADPERLADATFDRVADKLGDGEKIVDITGFVIGVARFVGLEEDRRVRGMQAAVDRERVTPPPAAGESLEQERMAWALERCLEGLEPAERTLIVDYHEGRGQARIDRRHQLAVALATTVNALRIRVHRLRARLYDCVTGHLGESPGNVSGRDATSGARGALD